MGVVDSDLAPGLGASARTLVAALQGRDVPTFVARDEHDPRKLFVVEHLTLEGELRAETVARVELLARAPHARLTRVRGFLERAGGIDVVSDFIDGELLSATMETLRAKGTALPTMCALRFISDVLSGLNTLHALAPFASRGHGDLTPRAVMVGLDGSVRLTELVRARIEPRRDAYVRFIAPEILAGAAPSPRGDLYAVGVMLAEVLSAGEDPRSDYVVPFLAVAERARAADPAERFESAAAMLSALAGRFRAQAPSHADVARLMEATTAERIRSRRASFETAPARIDAEVRIALGAPPSMPVTFRAEPLPGSRNASPFPGSLRAQSGIPSSPPPSSRRTDRPPPGFGSVPASGDALPLGTIPPLPALSPPIESRPSVASPSVASPSVASPSVVAPSVVASPSAVAAGPKVRRTVPMERVTPPPGPSAPPSAPVVASGPPARVADGERGPDSRPADSWRYASAKPIDPPRRAVTVPVPAESIIVEAGLDVQREASVGPTPTLPPAALTSSKVPPVELRSPSHPPRARSKLMPLTLAGMALVGLAAGGFALLQRRASLGHASLDRGAATRAPPVAPVAPVVPAAAPSVAVAPVPVATAAAAAAAQPSTPSRCPEGMVFLEGGAFTMGSDAPDAAAAAKPAHAVTVSPFCIDALEVSVAKFKACSDTGDCKRGLVTNDWAGITAAERAAYEPLCTLRDPAALASHPINCVDWERADIYCTAHGSRLPTEAEWELAARGRDGRVYPWGDGAPSPSLANVCGPECAGWAGKSGLESITALFDAPDAWLGTAPGNTFPAGATPEGVMDLAGNVTEWVADAFAPYSAAAQTNPRAASGDTRVVRGGSFVSGKRAALVSTYRKGEKATKRSSSLGFRCASPPLAVAGR